jgi:2-polyprenyl-6-methoxyphenol hydroxylase-like FAD-dependent oxidoreductase
VPSCRFPGLPSDDKHVIIVGAVPPDGRRGGGAIAVEGDSWLVTLGGLGGEQAPTEPQAFIQYARTLPVSDLYDLVVDGEPLGDPVLMRYPTARRRRYDRLERFPERLVVTGDALCSFNPIYGQGMSVAAVEAVALGTCLDAGTHGIGRRFFAAVEQVVGDAWGMAASGDAEFLPEVAGRRPVPERLIGGYIVRVMQAASHDPAVSRAFREVMAMTRRPPSLLHPRLAARVLAATWRTKGISGAVRPTKASAHSH